MQVQSILENGLNVFPLIGTEISLICCRHGVDRKKRQEPNVFNFNDDDDDDDDGDDDHDEVVARVDITRRRPDPF